MWVKYKQQGFTIVELLIVIVVIGILAAITLVAYNGIRNKGLDSAVQSDLAQLAKKYEIYRTNDSSGRYPVGNVQLEDLDVRIGNKNAYAISPDVAYNLLNCTSTASPGSDYALMAISKSGRKFYVSSVTGGVTEYTGATAWGALSMCTIVLANSGGNGAGYASADGWRAWTDG